MHIKKIVGFFVVLSGLVFLHHTYYVRGSRAGTKSLGVAFVDKPDALANVVKRSWDLIERALIEKDYIQKTARMDIPAKGEEDGDYYSDLDSRGINKIPDAQKVIEKVISDAVTVAMREYGALVVTDVQQAVQLSGIVQRVFFTMVWEYFSRPQSFDWCMCVTIEKRIELAVRVITDVFKQYPSEHRLKYTSIASGGLLQDYIILKVLQEYGYRRMTINVIDPGYFELSDIERLKKISPLPADKRHANYLLTVAEHIDELNEQEEHRAQEGVQALRISLRKRRDRATVLEELQKGTDQVSAESSAQELPGELDEYDRFIDTRSLAEFIKKLKAENGQEIEVIAWSDTQDYMERAKKYPAEKSDVIIMTDPDGGFFEQPYPSLANVVTLSLYGNRVTLFPRQFGAPLYAQFAVDMSRYPLLKAAAIRLYGRVLELVRQAETEHKNVVMALMNAFEKEDEQVAVDLAAAYKQKDTKKIKEFTEKYANPFFFDGGKITFKFDLDLYLLLQEMTKSVMADPARSLVYVLDLQKKDDESVPEIQKIDPRTYSFDDVLKVRKDAVCFEECTEITKVFEEEEMRKIFELD